MRRQAWRPLRSIRRPRQVPARRCPSATRSLFRRASFNPPHRTYYAPPEEFHFGLSLKARLIRSTAWALLFSTAGIAAGLYYRAWFYKKMARVLPDTEIDALMVTDILKQIDECPMVEAIKRDESFVEIWPLAMSEEASNKVVSNRQAPNPEAAHHLIFTALRGTRGVFPRAFYCESRGVLCVVVGFGYGTGGYPPNTPHGGIVTTMVHEGMRVLAQLWFPEDTAWKLSQLDVNFTRPLPLQSICCITIMPASTVKDLPQILTDPKLYGHWPDWLNTTDFGERVNTFLAYMGQSDGHPLHDPVLSHGHAAAKFEAEGPDWPPSQPASPVQLDMEGHIT